MESPNSFFSRLRRLGPSSGGRLTKEKIGTVVLLLLIGGLSLLAPILAPTGPEQAVGTFLALAGVLELHHSFRLVKDGARRAAYASSGITILMGILLINTVFLAKASLVLLVAGAFLVNGVQSALAAWRAGPDEALRRRQIASAAGNAAGAAAVLLLRGVLPLWTVPIAGGLRIFGT